MVLHNKSALSRSQNWLDFRENCWVEKRAMMEGVSSAAVCECNGKIYVIGGGPSVKVSTDKVQVRNY